MSTESTTELVGDVTVQEARDSDLPADHQVIRDLMAAGAATIVEQHGESDEARTLTAVVPAGYNLQNVQLPTVERAAPRRVKSSVTVTDTVSWLAYFGKHGGEHSEVFGDVRASTVTALLNAPAGPDAPAYGDHRVTLQLEHSAAWRAWTALDGKLLGQRDFAEHIEARTPDLRKPDAATALELAQSLQATKGLEFEAGSQLQNGQRTFVYRESIEAKAGQRGQIDIPTEFVIEVPVWRGVAINVPMTARFRYSLRSEGLGLGIVLDRVDDVLDAAWRALLSELTATLPVPVLAGKAPSYGGN